MRKWRKGEPMIKSFICKKEENLDEKNKVQSKITEMINKKEENNIKISKRKLVITRNLNPYISNNDYLKNISIQDKYLRPLDSNIQIIEQG